MSRFTGSFALLMAVGREGRVKRQVGLETFQMRGNFMLCLLGIFLPSPLQENHAYFADFAAALGADILMRAHAWQTHSDVRTPIRTSRHSGQQNAAVQSSGTKW